jgi:hypothetical protein
METAVILFTALAGVLAVGGAVLLTLTSHRDWGIWVSSVSAICVVLAATCTIQAGAWKQDAEAAKNVSPVSISPTIIPVPSAPFEASAPVTITNNTDNVRYDVALTIKPSSLNVEFSLEPFVVGLVTADGSKLIQIQHIKPHDSLSFRLLTKLKTTGPNETLTLTVDDGSETYENTVLHGDVSAFGAPKSPPTTENEHSK